ncbi:MAG: CRTAC1 family protein [Acidobacteria bacterium]|nr:MAG: CRTAC1 family protein [Acidobacteriota bacterium]
MLPPRSTPPAPPKLRRRAGGALLAFLLAAAGAPPPAAADGTIFADVAQQAGVDFVHWNGRIGTFYFPEMTGQGGALFDYDGDGDLDLYLVQGAMLAPGKKPADSLDPPPEPLPRDRLYRNDLRLLPGGRRLLRFTDVTERSGIVATGHGMGVATGDYDGDGDLDLYVTNAGPNQLWRNDGPGDGGRVTFTDVTAASGTGDPGWSTSAAFFDADRDGDLDLYVVNYVDFTPANNVVCYATSSRRDYCGPQAYRPLADRFYRNRGDGTFDDVTNRVLIGYRPGSGLGTASADFDGDRWPDLYVANDGEPNQLWLNRRDGTFGDDALLLGVAINRAGQAEASMGVAVADFDGDGDEDVFLTHLSGETNTLYVNDGSGVFEDRSIESGLAAPSLPLTGFGTGWLDVDGDGWLDLLVANGAVRILEDLASRGDDFPLAQPNQLFRNRGDGTFEDVSHRAGASFQQLEVSRGVAFGDLDNDGGADAVVFNNHGRPRLLRNRRPPAAWLGLRLIGAAAGRDMLGARVAVVLKSGRRLWRRAASDGSYCSASDPRVLVGLGGGGDPVVELRVLWPDGRSERFKPPPLGAYVTLRQGSGEPTP